MGLSRDLKDDLRRSINVELMKAKGIYPISDYTRSCAFCKYWERTQEVCTYHQLRFNGEENRCNNFSHR